jgi:hypothetical protein
MAMRKQRRRLIHFVALDTRDPLCGGDGEEAWPVAVNGVAVCSTCARRVAERAQRAAPRPVRAPPS